MASEFTMGAPQDRGGATFVLSLSGRLDAKAAQDLRKRCSELRQEGCIHLLLSMTDVEFIASSGIGTLLVLSEEFGEAGGTVHFVSLAPAVEQVVELLNLSQYLRIAATEEEAVATLAS